MLKKISKDAMHLSNQGWLESRFHFSFAEYHNPQNMHFGVLRVLNDDIVHTNSGFGMHPHRDMEIISYIVNGEITHKDSMDNERTLKRGEVQYMSAGRGVLHSEYNHSKEKDLRLLQIWILPPQKGLEPMYGEELYTESERQNRLLNIVSSKDGNAKVKIHQDVNIYVCELEAGKSVEYSLQEQRQIYFVQIEGTSEINGTLVNDSDAMEITDENSLSIRALKKSHFLFIEMKKM
ncbi:MAG: pirin family protein [Campylobacterales bacterium]|nr:pirin family protein [Campylobacterales bacterium]